MGAEAFCWITHAGRRFEAKVLLETSRLIVRGENRFDIPFVRIQSLEVQEPDLVIRYGDQEARFTLGPDAAKWKKKIESPPSLLDKLGLKPGMRVSMLGLKDSSFHELLTKIGITASTSQRGESDVILLGVEAPGDLDELPTLREHLAAPGAIWLVYPKGVKAITEAQVMQAIKGAGLVDVKVAAFSVTHTALKAVIPLAKRQAR